MKKILMGIMLIGSIFLTSAVTQAAPFIFTSSDSSNGDGADMQDLAHGYNYGWSIADQKSQTLANQLNSGKYEITKAELVFKDIYNWTHEDNDQLASFLLAAPPPMPGAEIVPVTINGVPQGHNSYTFTKTTTTTTSSKVTTTTEPENYTPPAGYIRASYTSKTDNHGKTSYIYTISKTTTTTSTKTSTNANAYSVSSGYKITDTKFIQDAIKLQAGVTLSNNLWEKIDDQSRADVNWGYYKDGSLIETTKIWDSGPNHNTNPWHDEFGGNSRNFYLTYTFDQDLINILNGYVADGSFGFGIDPDCHYYNKGVEFMVTTELIQTVPEPSTIVLLGGGLLLAAVLTLRSRRN